MKRLYFSMEPEKHLMSLQIKPMILLKKFITNPMGYPMAARQVGIWLMVILIIVASAPLSKAENLSLATGEWTPFTAKSMDGYGEFTQKVTTVFKEMGIEPSYRFYPWRRCYDAVVNARVWAAFPYSRTAEREKQVWFSAPLSCSRTVFFYYQEKNSAPKDFHFQRIEDLKAYRLGGTAGYFYEEIFQKAGLTVDYVNKEINSIEKLKIGRIDLTPVNERVGWHLIKTHFPDQAQQFKTISRPLDINLLRLIVSKDFPGSKQLLERFNQALKICIENGSIKTEQCQ